MTTPEVGPCTPPYLQADRFFRYVWVEAPDAMTGELVAFDMVDSCTVESNYRIRREDPVQGGRPSFFGRIVAGADMVTSIETVDWIDDELGATL